MALQRRNTELVELLRADFQPRNEPNFAWKSAVSAFSAIPGLIGLWPTSFVRRDSGTDRVRDVSGGGYHLTVSGAGVKFGYDNLMPTATFVAASSTYASRADGGAANWADVTGTEGFLVTADRGLTLGAWVYPTDSATASSIISKWGASGNFAYELRIAAGPTWTFIISDDGTNTDSRTSSDITDDVWHFVVGRFDPGANVELFVNGTWLQTATARASVFDSSADFYVGSRSGGAANFFDGQVSLAFLSCCYVPDVIVESLWYQTKAAFGR